MDTSLKFDSFEVNVDLAKKFIMENGDDIKNRIEPKINKDASRLPLHKRNKILAEKIKENTKLICQLEYLTNNTPIEDTERNIQLILKYVSLSDKYKPINTCPISMLKDTPLVCLMCATVHDSCDERASVCHLFLKLRSESGFDHAMVKGLMLLTYDCMGAVGVVAERSDLDSAVDAFLTSSSNDCCWRLSRIFVQESIYQLFKELIGHKAELKRTCATEYEELKSQCAQFFVYEKKVILFDYAGDAKIPQLKDAHAIYVEAYRTNKELLSLVGGKGKICCVSLWSADVAEANEIAYNVPASLVWINDYGNFDGPPEIYNFVSNHFNNDKYETVPESLLNRYETWKKFDNKKRLTIISDVLEKVVNDDALSQESTRKSNIVELQELIWNFKFNSVDVADGKMCVTLDSPVGLTLERTSVTRHVDNIRSLVVGNGIILNYQLPDPLYDELSRAGVPVWYENEEEGTINVLVHEIQYQTKVVLTNFGTIFAN